MVGNATPIEEPRKGVRKEVRRATIRAVRFRLAGTACVGVASMVVLWMFTKYSLAGR
jgi:hypothetical protein